MLKGSVLDFFKSKKQRKQDELERKYFTAVYGVLVTLAGADIDRTNCFVESHLSRGERDARSVCKEWRFCGEFGTGGKYWRERNAVTYYDDISKDPELEVLKNDVNETLQAVYTAYRLMGMEFLPNHLARVVSSHEPN